VLIEDFRFLTLNDEFDNTYLNWSRSYEYPYILKSIGKYIKTPNIIHNTSWGYEGVHNIFREKLDSLYNVIHSDIKKSNYPRTKIWDIRTPPTNDELNLYDVVINVSTIEEVKDDHLFILKNLFSMVKSGGILAVTMDFPGAQLDKIEDWLDRKVQNATNKLNGNNSSLPNNRYKHLNVIGLILRK